MKTPIKFGVIAAVAGFAINLVLFFAGMHNDPAEAAKHTGLNILFGAIGFGIPIACIVLAIRERRASSLDGSLTLGQALGTAMLTGLVIAVVGGIFHVIYLTVVNPAWHEAMINMQTAAMDQQNMPADARKMAEKMMRIFMNPAMQAAMGLLIWALVSLVVGLIAGAVLKREPQGNVPPAVPTV